ncbi:MAG: hypothetical protein JST89_22280 [Cyanobacteria bacterium SZAS-4]|nr:hypothetical protein [Cyanobacteria bacterium SZAS-4]
MVSESRARLELLQLDEQSLFHGSGLKILELEPRQAYTIIDGVNTPDGEPAIYASQFIDYAIFMALINKENCPTSTRSSCSYEYDQLVFGATQKTLDQLNENKNAIGYVHVLRRSAFTLRGGSEWFATEMQKPHEIIEVRRADFTEPIDIIDDSVPIIDAV